MSCGRARCEGMAQFLGRKNTPFMRIADLMNNVRLDAGLATFLQEPISKAGIPFSRGNNQRQGGDIRKLEKTLAYESMAPRHNQPHGIVGDGDRSQSADLRRMDDETAGPNSREDIGNDLGSRGTVKDGAELRSESVSHREQARQQVEIEIGRMSDLQLRGG